MLPSSKATVLLFAMTSKLCKLQQFSLVDFGSKAFCANSLLVKVSSSHNKLRFIVFLLCLIYVYILYSFCCVLSILGFVVWNKCWSVANLSSGADAFWSQFRRYQVALRAENKPLVPLPSSTLNCLAVAECANNEPFKYQLWVFWAYKQRVVDNYFCFTIDQTSAAPLLHTLYVWHLRSSKSINSSMIFQDLSGQ